MRGLVRLLVAVVFVAAALANAPWALAANVPGAVHQVGTGSAKVRADPSIAVDPSNGGTLSVAYNEQPSSGQPFRPRVATSFDRGVTWPVVITLPVPAGQHYLNNTSLAALGGGHLVATYLVVGTFTLNGAKRDLESVVATSSADSGRTWSAPAYVYQAQLTAGGACTASDSTRTSDVAVAVDPRLSLHRAYIAWLSDDECLGEQLRYHLARSNDNGRTWSLGASWEPAAFDGSAQALDVLPPHASVGPSGYVYVGYTGVYSTSAFCSSSGVASTSVMARSPDAGHTVQSYLMMRSCAGFSVPRTVVNPRTRAIVTVLDNGPRLHILRSIDGGVHWQDPNTTQPAPAPSRSPSLTATPDGNIALVAVGGSACHPQLFRSADDGSTWAAPKALSTNADALCPQDTQTAIAVGSDNVLHPVWAERPPLSQGSALWTAERKSTAAV